MLHRDSEALEHVEPFLGSNQVHPVALYFAGAAYMRLGQRGRAVEVIEQAVQVMERLPFYLGWAAGRTASLAEKTMLARSSKS